MFVSDGTASDGSLLADAFADALTGWDSLKAEDGSTAADLAEQSGAQGINAMIQRKLQGQPSGVRAQQFEFDPDTGEWIDTDAGHSDFQTEDWLPVTGRSDDPAPLMVPAMHNLTRLTPDEAISGRGVPRHIKIEAADNLLAMSSRSSSGVAEELHKSEDFAEVLSIGLRQRGEEEGQGSDAYRAKELISLKHKARGKRDVPRVFDAQAALVSSAVVGAVGVCALGLRFCFEWCQI